MPHKWTEADRRIRDVRHRKHRGGRRCVWHKCPYYSAKFTGRQWLSHEYQCPAKPPRPPKPIIVDFGRVKQKRWGSTPIRWHKCPHCLEKFTGRQWLAHTCKEKDRKSHGGMWLETPPLSKQFQADKQELPVLPRILEGNNGAVTGAIAPRDVFAHVIDTRKQEFQRPKTRPLGRGYCMRHSFSREVLKLWCHGEGDSYYVARHKRGILRSMLPGVSPEGLNL